MAGVGRFSYGWRALALASIGLAVGGPVSGQIVNPDGALDDEVLLLLDISPKNGVADIFDFYPAYKGKGFAGFRLDGERHADIDGLVSELDSAGDDGFRDAGIAGSAGPPSGCDTCMDGNPNHISKYRSALNTGKLTIIYLRDSTGSLADGDDSLLYVGMDIFNGDRRRVPTGATGVPDQDYRDVDFIDMGLPGICLDGIADYNGDNTPDFLCPPFDVDCDGVPDVLGRWPPPWDPNCVPPEGLSDDAPEKYRVRLYVCPPPDFAEGMGVTGGDPERGLLGFVQIYAEEGEPDVMFSKSSAFNVPGVQYETHPAAGTPLDSLGVSDVEFAIRKVDTLIDALFAGTTYEIDRLRIAQGGIQTLSDNDFDQSAEDIISASWFLPVPSLEVTKEVRCVTTPGPNDWRESVEALPGSKLEFRVTVENTGNIMLTVSLADLLAPSDKITPDPGSLQVFLNRPRDPSQSGPVTWATAPTKDPPLCQDFFDSPIPGEQGFLTLLDGTPVGLGILLPVDVCTNPSSPILGDNVVITFTATINPDADFCTEPQEIDVSNSVTAVGDPDVDLTTGCPLPEGDPGQTLGNEVKDEYGQIDTYRENHVNVPPADDNVVTGNVLCRRITFDKKVAYCTDCNNPNTCTPYGDTATIPPFVEPPVPNDERCVRFRYTVTNTGDTKEMISIEDELLCADVATVNGQYPGEIELVNCDVCPKFENWDLNPGESVTVYCMLKFYSQRALDEFLAIDQGANSRPCPDQDCPGVDDPDCYCNWSLAKAEPVAGDYCNDGPTLEVVDCATVCSECPQIQVTKDVKCVDPNNPNAPWDPDVIDVVPGSRVRFRIVTENTSPWDPTDPNANSICSFRITDRLEKANGTLAGSCITSSTPQNVSFKITKRDGGVVSCAVPACFNIIGNLCEFDPRPCLGGRNLYAGEKLTIEFEVVMANDADCIACDLTNKATIEAAGDCPTSGPQYCVSAFDQAGVDVKCAALSCIKEWSVIWDKNADCQVTTVPPDGYIDWSDYIDLGTGDGGLPIIFPARLCARLTVYNDGEVDLIVKPQDTALCNALTACGLVLDPNCGFCPTGTSKTIPVGGWAQWTCCFLVPTREKMLCLAQQDGGGDPGLLENCVTVTGTPTNVCPGTAVVSNECCAYVAPPPECSFEVNKTVVCADCATGNEIPPGPAKLIQVGPGACTKWIIEITNVGQGRIPRLKVHDDITPNQPFTNCKASIDGTGCTGAFCPLVDCTPKEIIIANCRPGLPWLDPGETLKFELWTTVGQADVHNSVNVKGYSEVCGPAPDLPSCGEANSSAEGDVLRPGIICEKYLSADYGDDGTYEKPDSDYLILDPADSGFAFPIRVKYGWTVTNTGQVPLDNIILCDPHLVAWANASNVLIENCVLCTGACNDGIGDDCTDPGQIPPLPTSTSWAGSCELVFMDETELETFLCKDDLNPNNCDKVLRNISTVTGDGNYSAMCPPPNPISVSAECEARLRYKKVDCPWTKAKVTIWNENEISFSGTERCVVSWDGRLLSEWTKNAFPNNPTPPNSFLRQFLGTNKGHARIDGVESIWCPDSTAAPLLGVAARIMELDGDPNNIAVAAEPLLCSGNQAGQLTLLDLESPPLPGGEPIGGPIMSFPYGMVPSGNLSPFGGDYYIPQPEQQADADGESGSAPALATNDRVSTTQKGSLLVFAKVEIKWDAAGNLIQDTFISIDNDLDQEVRLVVLLVNAEPPGYPDECQAVVNNEIYLTHDEPTYWSVLTGDPKGLSPFTTTGPPQLDLDPRNPGGTHLHGYIIAWAVDPEYREIRWNHLSGTATLVNYKYAEAWEYGAWAFRALMGTNSGDLLAAPYGKLNLEGIEYDWMPDKLLLDFFAPGAQLLSKDGRWLTVVDTDLTLWIGINDLTEE